MGIKYLDRATGEIKFFNESTIDEFIDFEKFDSILNKTQAGREVLATVVLNRVKIEFFFERILNKKNINCAIYANLTEGEQLGAENWIFCRETRRLLNLRLETGSRELVIERLLDELINLKKYDNFYYQDEAAYSYKDLFEKDVLTPTDLKGVSTRVFGEVDGDYVAADGLINIPYEPVNINIDPGVRSSIDWSVTYDSTMIPEYTYSYARGTSVANATELNSIRSTIENLRMSL